MTTTTASHLEQLNAKRAALRDSLVRAQTNVETAQREMERLEKEALEKFGTSDIEKLAELLAKKEQANHQAVVQYEQSLEQLESDLRLLKTQLQTKA